MAWALLGEGQSLTPDDSGVFMVNIQSCNASHSLRMTSIYFIVLDIVNCGGGGREPVLRHISRWNS